MHILKAAGARQVLDRRHRGIANARCRDIPGDGAAGLLVWEKALAPSRALRDLAGVAGARGGGRLVLESGLGVVKDDGAAEDGRLVVRGEGPIL